MASCEDCTNGIMYSEDGRRTPCSCGGRGDAEIARLRAEVATLKSELAELQRDLDAAVAGNRQYRHTLDARPEITPQDAAKFNECMARGFQSEASTRVFGALRDHAVKVVKS